MARTNSGDFEVVEFNEMDPKRGPVTMHVYKRDHHIFKNTSSYVMKVQLAFKIVNTESGEVYKDRPEKID